MMGRPDVAIEAEGRSRHFGSNRAVDGLPLEVPPGILFLQGDAARSVLARMESTAAMYAALASMGVLAAQPARRALGGLLLHGRS
jgi:hypothetical protein